MWCCVFPEVFVCIMKYYAINDKVCIYTLCGYVGTLYYFGDNDRDGWRDLFNKYKFPPYEIPKLKPEISFGMAGKLVCVLLECFHEDTNCLFTAHHKIMYVNHLQ